MLNGYQKIEVNPTSQIVMLSSLIRETDTKLLEMRRLISQMENCLATGSGPNETLELESNKTKSRNFSRFRAANSNGQLSQTDESLTDSELTKTAGEDFRISTSQSAFADRFAAKRGLRDNT